MLLLVGVATNIFQTKRQKVPVYIWDEGRKHANSSLTSMAAEDLLINDSSNGEAVKAVSKGLPQLNVEPALAWWNT